MFLLCSSIGGGILKERNCYASHCKYCLMLNVLYAYTFCILIVDNASIKVLHKGITASTMEWK
jgi:hypothetical protein